MKCKLIIFALFLLQSLNIHAQKVDLVEQFKNEYEEGRIDKIVRNEELFLSMIKPFAFSTTVKNLDKEEKTDGLRFLAFSHILLRDYPSAIASIKELLRINRKYQTDPKHDPPEFIVLFKEVKG